MITVGMYYKVEDSGKGLIPDFVYPLSDDVGPLAFKTRRQAKRFLLELGVSPSDLDSFLFLGSDEKV